MKRYIDEPLQEGENILLDTGRGANPQTKAEIEKERQIFLKNIFFAFKELDKKRITVPKQKDLRPYIFKPYKDVEQKISETLRKHKLRFKDLWRIYLLNKSLESFLSAVNTTK